MHATSQENMLKCYERYLQSSFFDAREAVVVLEVGSAEVNGGYRDIFSHPKIQYCGADLVQAEGVDLVLKSPYEIPLPDGHADVVVSGQMLEHSAYFWLSFQEMIRVLKPDGILFLIAPSSGPIHRYPVDCYRFYPDSFVALAELTGSHLVDSWLDERGPWKDLVGVFAKEPRSKWTVASETPRAIMKPVMPAKRNSWLKDLAGVFSRRKRNRGARAARLREMRQAGAPVDGESIEDAAGYNNDAKLNVVSGAENYLRLLETIHRKLSPRLYLEIGVRRGKSLRLSACTAIGLDPEPAVDGSLSEAVTIYRKTSDAFFEFDAKGALQGEIDLAFIDGMHLFEYALRDFINIERFSASTSLVVVDDVFPSHPMQARRARETRVWTGDVWKLLVCLKKFRRDLIVLPVDTSPGGSLLIAGLDPSNRELIEKYNPIVRQFVADTDEAPPSEILKRRGAIQPNDGRIVELLGLLRSLREKSEGEQWVRERLGIFAKRLV